jgi:hypothetical protein
LTDGGVDSSDVDVRVGVAQAIDATSRREPGRPRNNTAL